MGLKGKILKFMSDISKNESFRYFSSLSWEKSIQGMGIKTGVENLKKIY